MPIKVRCQCGQSFAAKDNLAGRTVKCPKCGQALRIPSPQAPAGPAQTPQQGAQQPTTQQPQQPAAPLGGGLGGLLDEAGLGGPEQSASAGPKCPSCGAAVQPGAIICIECGYNAQSGQRMNTIGGIQSDAPAAGAMSDAERMVAKAEKELKENPGYSTDYGDGATAYLIAAACVLTVFMALSFGAGFLWVVQEYIIAVPTGSEEGSRGPQSTARTVAFMIDVFGMVIMTIAWVEIVGTAMTHRLVHGVLSLFFLPYALVYAIVNGVVFGRALLLWSIGLIVKSVAVLVIIEFEIVQAGDTSRILCWVAAATGYHMAGWCWAMITGLAYSEKPAGTLHGTLSLLVPGYGFVFGLIRVKPYLNYCISSVVCMVVAIVLFIVYFVMLAKVL